MQTNNKPILSQIDWLNNYLKKMEILNNFDFSDSYNILSGLSLEQYNRFKKLIFNNQIISIKKMLIQLGIKEYENKRQNYWPT